MWPFGSVRVGFLGCDQVEFGYYRLSCRSGILLFFVVSREFCPLGQFEGNLME